jgi:hypothetical protein
MHMMNAIKSTSQRQEPAPDLIRGRIHEWMDYFGIGMRYTDAVEPDD